MTSSSALTMSAKRTHPFTVAIEGNIGSGKSTMLKVFKEFAEVQLLPEPVSKWCDLKGHNLLGLLYEDPDRWSFQFQSFVQLTRLQLLLRESKAASETTDQNGQQIGVKILERSIQNNRCCFLELARKLKSLCEEELAVLNEWHDWLESTMDLKLDLIVYLRTTPEVAYERMRVRNRKEEAGAPLSYLQSLHTAYEEWLIQRKFGDIKAPILVLDADQDLDEMISTYKELSDTIRGKTILEKPIQYHEATSEDKENSSKQSVK